MPSGWNDEVSSIKIENCNSRGVILYEDVGIDNNNNCQLTLCYNDNNLGDNQPSFNDKTSAVRIVGFCEAILYVDADYKGFLEATGPSFYKLSDYNLNNEVSSIEVVNGYKNGRIELYTDESYTGNKEIFIYDDKSLWDNYIWDSTASSIKVYPGANGCYARLYTNSNYSGVNMSFNENDLRLSENGPYAWWADHLRNYPYKGDENILIFAHHPLYINSNMFNSLEYNKIASLLYPYKNSVNAWFAGHYHYRLSDGSWWPPWNGGWVNGTQWDIIYNNAVVARGYFVDANAYWSGPFYTGYIMLVRLQYSSGLKNLVAQSDIPEATGYNNSRRLLRDANGMLHLCFTSENHIYHTFLQDTIWSEPMVIGEGKYPALAVGSDGKIYCTWAYHGYQKFAGEMYYVEYLMMSSYNGITWSEPQILFHTYGTFLWGVGAPSLAIRDTVAYVAFKSYHGPHPHPVPGFPAPHIVVDDGPALIYGTFSLNNPAFQWTYADTIIKHLITVDTLTYADSMVPLLISPSINVDLANVPHILWEGDSTFMRYYTITDSGITKQLFDNGVDFPSISMNGDQIQLFYTARDSIRYRYSWTGTTNLSEIQTIATCESPIAINQYLTWTKRENDVSHLYYGAIPASGQITPIEVNHSTDLISYPQILFNPAKNNTPASIDLVWTEFSEIDSLGYIYYLNVPLTEVAPIYAFDMGTEIPVPVLVQRDGFMSLGPENYQTLDYDSTELIYHLTLHSPHIKYKVRWTYYHEEPQKLKLQFNIDDILHHNRWVNPGEKITEEACIPNACLHDNEITIKVKKLSGTIAVLSGIEIEVEEVGEGGPQGGEAQILRPFYFGKIYPNPTKGMIRIRFNSPDRRRVSVKIYDVTGRLASTVFEGRARIGMNEFLIRPKDFATGIYFIRLEAEGYTKTEKVIFLK